MVDVRMNSLEVEAFCAGQLDEAGEAALAYQVSQVVAFEPLVPNEATTYLERVVRHLGGQSALLDWLDRFPGEPTLVSSSVHLADLLGALSSLDAVVDAIRQIRRESPDAGPIRLVLPPVTDHVTLSDLAEGLLLRLREGDSEGTLALASASLDLVERALDRAAGSGADVTLAQTVVVDTRQRVVRAATSMLPEQRS
jgi:hypothetical protein